MTKSKKVKLVSVSLTVLPADVVREVLIPFLYRVDQIALSLTSKWFGEIYWKSISKVVGIKNFFTLTPTLTIRNHWMVKKVLSRLDKSRVTFFAFYGHNECILSTFCQSHIVNLLVKGSKEICEKLYQKWKKKRYKFNQFNYKSVKRVLKELPNLKTLDIRGTFIQVDWKKFNKFTLLNSRKWTKWGNRPPLKKFVKALDLSRVKGGLYNTIVERFLRTKEANNNVLKILAKLRKRGFAKNLKKVKCTAQNLLFTEEKMHSESINDVVVRSTEDYSCKKEMNNQFCQFCNVPLYCQICGEFLLEDSWPNHVIKDKNRNEFHTQCINDNMENISVIYTTNV